MSEQNQHLDALQDIRKMMQRSSRFISLSGLSGVAAGLWALAGAWFARKELRDYYAEYHTVGIQRIEDLRDRLFLIAGGVLLMALLSAFYFTWRRAGKTSTSLWDHSSRQLAINTFIPLITGGLFIMAMIQQGAFGLIAPACLVFYGLALVNGSRYTISDIRYLGFFEIAIGLVSTQFIGYGIHFWALGFGVMHIIYGFIMWWKYERNPASVD